VLVPEFLGSPLYKPLNIVDSPADEIGQPSRSIGYAGTLFEADNFELGPAAASLGSGTHPGTIAAYHHQAFFGHT
jgi:hypothetical protein